MLSGDNGILQKATESKTETEKGQEKEIVALAYNSALAKKVGNGNSSAITDSELNAELDNSEATASGNPIIVTFIKSGNAYKIDSNGNIEKSVPPEPLMAGAKVRDSKENKVALNNTELVDDYGNTITIPKGFKIVDGTNVVDGIVIEDVNAETQATVGNQFVWIPVGTEIKKSETETIEIKLGRYTFDASDGTPNLIQEASKTDYTTGIALNSSFYEYDASNISCGNVKAKALNLFISSTIDKSGFYIGRFEAGINGNTDQYTLAEYTYNVENSRYEPGDSSKVVAKDGSIKPQSKSGTGVWNAVTQAEAATISRNMYVNLNSDLVNSYAWDTAITFIKKCGTNTNYANKTDGNGQLKTTGNNNDEQCHINDISGNVTEWTTESCLSYNDSSPCVGRGGFYAIPFPTAIRNASSTVSIGDNIGFRSILYL